MNYDDETLARLENIESHLVNLGCEVADVTNSIGDILDDVKNLIDHK